MYAVCVCLVEQSCFLLLSTHFPRLGYIKMYCRLFSSFFFFSLVRVVDCDIQSFDVCVVDIMLRSLVVCGPLGVAVKDVEYAVYVVPCV